MKCPKDREKMVIKKSEERTTFRGIDLKVPVEHYICPDCDTKAGTVDQTSVIQKTVSDTYRKGAGLLTGKEIVEGRKKLNLTQEAFAKRMNVGIASIKRWEGCQIQSKSMDHALRLALKGQSAGDICTGNRSFSIPRIKSVLKQFESALGRHILKKNDKMLFAAKYLWYADMVAHRELGESMTGSTYAALSFGPQLNNYKDLVDNIINADESAAEPLTPEEKRIVNCIAMRFPREQMVYDAAHRETAFTKQPIGAIIPYSDSRELREV
jgi:putative zinc finger/helix-turn-helix YgiT family protein